MSKSEESIYVQLSFALIEKRSDGILVFRPSELVVSPTIEQLQEVYAAFMDLQAGTKGPFFSDNRFVKQFGAPQKEFIHSRVHHFASCAAFYSNSPLTTFMHNAFLYLYQPIIPMKIFTSEERAFDWLNTQSMGR